MRRTTWTEPMTRSGRLRRHRGSRRAGVRHSALPRLGVGGPKRRKMQREPGYVDEINLFDLVSAHGGSERTVFFFHGGLVDAGCSRRGAQGVQIRALG